jgi:hypothetical protein
MWHKWGRGGTHRLLVDRLAGRDLLGRPRLRWVGSMAYKEETWDFGLGTGFYLDVYNTILQFTVVLLPHTAVYNSSYLGFTLWLPLSRPKVFASTSSGTYLST